MAFGDLIYNQLVPSSVPFSIGSGLTSLPDEFVLTGRGKGNNSSAKFDVLNSLAYLGSFSTPEAFSSIQYHEDSNTYWALAPYVDVSPSSLNQTLVYHFSFDGMPISSFNVKSLVPAADKVPNFDTNSGKALSLTPDNNTVLVAWEGSTRIYRFSTSGSYLGYHDISVPNFTYINGITNDGEFLWISLSNDNIPVEMTVLKTDTSFSVLDQFSKVMIPSDYGPIDNIEDIEFDKYNFRSGCALIVKGNRRGVGNEGMRIYGFEVTCPICQEPPEIDASNKCLYVGDTFNPLTGVTATNCDGTDLTAIIVVTANNVNTAVPGLYSVTYRVTSPTNGKTTTKTIWVRVVQKGPHHQAITDLIESVALEQAAIATIVDAEGRKMQKAKDMQISHEKMLEINKSIEDMTNAITTLEMVLHGKLNIVDCDICGPKCVFPE